MGTFTKKTLRRPAKPRSKRLQYVGTSSSSASASQPSAVSLASESSALEITATVIHLGAATLWWDSENGVVRCDKEIVVSPSGSSDTASDELLDEGMV